MDEKLSNIICIILVALVLISLLFLLLKKKKCEGYKKCICSSRQGTERNCQDTEAVDALYRNNVLTEYTDLKSKGWTNISAGDYSFPHSTGCNWCDKITNPEWTAWDYTQF